MSFLCFSVPLLNGLSQQMATQGLLSSTDLVEDAGSVVCLCILVRFIRWSFMDICTSAGISGDVWLIFTAASKKPRGLVSFSLSAMISCAADFREAGLLAEIALLLQGTQHSFQKRKRKTATKASPHTITITVRRLMESSRGQEKATVTKRDSRELGRNMRKGEQEEKRKECL